MEDADHFWRGPVRTRERAVAIIRTTGWIFAGLAALAVLGLIQGGALQLQSPSSQRTFLGTLVLVLLLGMPAGFLLTRRSRAPAIILLGLSILTSVLSLGIGIALVTSHVSASAVVIVPVFLFWSGLTLLSWRALRAANALRRMTSEGR